MSERNVCPVRSDVLGPEDCNAQTVKVGLAGNARQEHSMPIEHLRWAKVECQRPVLSEPGVVLPVQ